MKVPHKKLDSKLEAVRVVFTSVNQSEGTCQGKMEQEQFSNSFMELHMSLQWALSSAVPVGSFFL